MSDLFDNIPKGSLLLWYVESEADLPKRKELIRLLGVDKFTYYKTDGHHRRYIHLLGRVMDCLNPSTDERKRGYMRHRYMSHFLFTAQRIDINSFFLLKYSTQCLGAFHVSKKDFEDLDQLLRRYNQVTHWAQLIQGWPSLIESHKESLQSEAIEDSVIASFDISKLTHLTEGYGLQAIDNTKANLQAWHDQFFWKNKTVRQADDTLFQVCTV
jgi:hypothetical protein